MNVLLIILGLLFLYYGLYLFLKRAPRRGKRFLIEVLLTMLAIVFVALAFTGRLHWLLGLFAGLLPFSRKLLPLLRFLPIVQTLFKQQKSRHHSGGQSSEVNTRWLRMSLDHDSGATEGFITTGPYEGQRLTQLGITELIDLYRLCQQHDPEAIRLLDTYIQRNRAEEWEQATAKKNASPPDDQTMTVEEALAILGLKCGADRDAIINAHKRMISRVHPDRGGSNYLAVKINQAKERLMKETT